VYPGDARCGDVVIDHVAAGLRGGWWSNAGGREPRRAVARAGGAGWADVAGTCSGAGGGPAKGEFFALDVAGGASVGGVVALGDRPGPRRLR